MALPLTVQNPPGASHKGPKSKVEFSSSSISRHAIYRFGLFSLREALCLAFCKSHLL